MKVSMDWRKWNWEPPEFERIFDKPEKSEMTTEEMIKVMQAYQCGKTIQYQMPGGGWDDCLCTPVWAWDANAYRIKPEPRKPNTRTMKLTCVSPNCWMQASGWQYQVGAVVEVFDADDEFMEEM